MVQQGLEMVRYADDFVILCKSKDQAERALNQVQAWVQETGLTLHPEKTRIADAVTESVTVHGHVGRPEISRFGVAIFPGHMAVQGLGT